LKEVKRYFKDISSVQNRATNLRARFGNGKCELFGPRYLAGKFHAENVVNKFSFQDTKKARYFAGLFAWL
jgi:hypothetical protein